MRCQSTQFTEPKPFPIEVVFQRRGNRVDGQCSFGLGLGTIKGKETGDMLNFEWNWANNYGRGVFKANQDGSTFSGTWGYRELTDNAGTWSGHRSDQSIGLIKQSVSGEPVSLA